MAETIAIMHIIPSMKYPRLQKFKISRVRHPKVNPIIPPNISLLAAKTGKINTNKNATNSGFLSRCSCLNSSIAVEAPVTLPINVTNNRNKT